jgi:hypothetical protein
MTRPTQLAKDRGYNVKYYVILQQKTMYKRRYNTKIREEIAIV